jgi:hypothetical protein
MLFVLKIRSEKSDSGCLWTRILYSLGNCLENRPFLWRTLKCQCVVTCNTGSNDIPQVRRSLKKMNRFVVLGAVEHNMSDVDSADTSFMSLSFFTPCCFLFSPSDQSNFYFLHDSQSSRSEPLKPTYPAPFCSTLTLGLSHLVCLGSLPSMVSPLPIGLVCQAASQATEPEPCVLSCHGRRGFSLAQSPVSGLIVGILTLLTLKNAGKGRRKLEARNTEF